MSEAKIDYSKYGTRHQNFHQKLDENVSAIPVNHFKVVLKILRNQSKRFGLRNYLIMLFAYSQLLRMNDVLNRKYSEIYDGRGKVRTEKVAFRDLKTNKPNTLTLTPIRKPLEQYRRWRIKHEINSIWLFPSSQATYHQSKQYGYHDRPLSVHTYYLTLKKVQRTINHDFGWRDKLSCHLGRKEGATRIYNQTHDLHLVQSLLNHSYPQTTEAYLNLTEQTKEDAKEKYLKL